MPRLNLLNQRFGKLVVIEHLGSDHRSMTRWRCKCDCGIEKIAFTKYLVSGKNKKCGPSCDANKNNEIKSTLYKRYRNMIQRCSDKKYKSHAGKGVKVCNEWLNYQKFKSDMGESFAEHANLYGERNTTLDRIDTSGDYSLENCRWATQKIQQNNRTNNAKFEIDGVMLNVTEIAEKFKINKKTLFTRLHLGWDIKKAINEPIKKRRSKVNIA